MSSFVPRSVAVTLSAELSHLTIEIAQELRRQTGCTLYLFVPGQEAVRKYKCLEDDGFAEVVECAAAFEQELFRTDLCADTVFQTARQIENFIGCTYNEILMTRRDFGLGFSLAGYHHPRSPASQNSSYVQVVNVLNHQLTFWRNALETRNIDLVLNGLKDLSVVCRALGIRQRIVTGARHKNYYFWACDEFFRQPGIEKEFFAGYDPEIAAASLDQPYAQDVNWRKRTFDGNKLYTFLQGVRRTAMRYAYLRYKGYRSHYEYFFWENIKFLWNRMVCRKEVLAPKNAHLKSVLDGKTFIFFPLHTEPELSVQGLSPEYFCQLSAIASLARDLPAGAYLAVKETPYGIGRRPRDFYNQIREFKNVVLLDVREKGLDVIKSAAAVATITGTAGLEAAILGIPVLTFGRHNAYDFLAHVMQIRSEDDIRPALAKVVSKDIDYRKAAIDGANLLRALIHTSFDMCAYDASNPGKVEEGAVHNAAHALIASLSSVS